MALVRESRFTKQMIENTGEFTVNIPYGDVDSKILGFCGTKSGKNVDKIRELGLHLVDSDAVSVPGIKELPLTIECRVIYKQKQDLNAIPQSLLEKFYPKNVDGSAPGKNRDYHIMYYGEILNAYLITE